MPSCRCCKIEINKADTNSWIMPSKNWYYHKSCYENWIKKKDDVTATAEADEWKDLLWDYLRRDIKLPNANYHKFENQWHSFLYKNKKKMTGKGLFFACRYFYEVMHGNKNEAQGGIGILPYVYDDSCAYWQTRSMTNTTICEKIEEQIKQNEQREVIKVAPRVVKKEKPRFSLADVMELEDEDDTSR